jgi:hypothetical protein
MNQRDHPAIANARWVLEQEEFERRLRAPERRELARFWRALVLAPTVEVFEALLDGESVPVDQLDQAWLERFGIDTEVRA